MKSLSISGKDLESWAPKHEATAQLPALVRRLILATSYAKVSMRADEGVRLSGFDGIVTMQGEHSFIPTGASVWEMGTNKDPGKKAQSDYKTRTNDPLTANPSDTTFVFVTPRRWRKDPGSGSLSKEEWVAKKRREGFWKDVVVLDADELAGWLDNAPSVEAWLRHLLGWPQGVFSLEQFWSGWAGVTTPELTPAVVTVGWNSNVENPIEEVVTKLLGPATSFGLRAESPTIAAAFLAGILQEDNIDGEQKDSSYVAEIERAAARTLFVEDAHAWHILAAQRDPLILVPLFTERDRVTAAVENGHHVVIPLGRKDQGNRSIIDLQRQRRSDIEKALSSMALTAKRTSTLATVARRSLTTLRRKLAHIEAVHTPAWSNSENAQRLIAPMLVGSWQVNDKRKDTEILATLANKAYAEVEKDVVHLAEQDEPPLRRVGHMWLVTSKEDVWQQVAHSLTHEDMKRFHEVAVEVLGTIDPQLDLPIEERFFAELRGKIKPYSELLCEDLADTLALMGARSEETDWHLNDSPQLYVDRIVKQLLSQESSKAWASIASGLPKLAEASPDIFLDIVRRALDSETPLFADLFQDHKRSSIFGASSPHTQLLCALELLAWSPKYLLQVCRILGRLEQLDPGGILANRPYDSLKQILSFWSRNTGADIKGKLRAVDSLRHHMPDTAWRLMNDYLSPNRFGYTRSTCSPTWRDWGQESGRSVPKSDMAEFYRSIASRLIEDAKPQNVDHALNLLEHCGQFDAEHQEKTRKFLEETARIASDTDKGKLWRALRQLILKHSGDSSANQPPQTEGLRNLKDLQSLFVPDDPVERTLWLFDSSLWFFDLNRQEGDDANSYEKQRVEALRIILDQQGSKGIERLLERLEESREAQALGRLIGETPGTDLESADYLLSLLNEQENGVSFVRGVLHAWQHRKGLDDVEAFLTSDPVTSWPMSQHAQVLHSLPATQRTWNLINDLGESVEREYWKTFSLYSDPIGRGQDEVRKAVEKLRAYKRPCVAFEVMKISNLDWLGDEWIELLAEMSTEDIKVVLSIKWEIREVLNELMTYEDVDAQRLVEAAWAFLPCYRFERPPEILIQASLKEPVFFADLVATARPRPEIYEDLDDQGKANQRLAAELLNSLRGLPGMDEGKIDEQTLFKWFQSARERFKQLNLIETGDAEIGRLLSTAPTGSDGHWPLLEIANIIEAARSEALEKNFLLGRYNLRGMAGTTRPADVGGEQERELVAKYERYAEEREIAHPRTAAVLRSLAKLYQSDAQRQDDEADLTQDRWR